MSFGIGQLKYEIDKITRLTSATKRLPLFAYLFQAMVNEALVLSGKEDQREKDLALIRTFTEQETVQTMFIILYPLYKNLCMLTGRNPKDVAILLAKAIATISIMDRDELQTRTGLNLKQVAVGETMTRVALAYMLQGRTTSSRKQQILPDAKTLFEKLAAHSFSSIKAQTSESNKIEQAAFHAALSVIFLAIFMNMLALDKFQTTDDESRAASLVLQKAVEAFRDNDVYDLPEFSKTRTDVMKPRMRGMA
jgi:hypothetical protein